MEGQNLAYGTERLKEAASTFRKLSGTYLEIAREMTSCSPATKAIATQLNEMAAVLEGYIGEDSRIMPLEAAQEVQIEKLLRARGIKVNNMKLLKRGDGHLEFSIEMKCARRGGTITPHEAAAMFSRFFKKEFVSDSQNRLIINGNYNEYTFLESGRFDVTYGVARANKNGNAVSGDSYSVSNLKCGKTIISLVDGMGSGEQAFRESRRVVELLEQFVEAGFREESSIELINAAFSINDTVGVPVTVDLCVVDTFFGICNCIKLGAVSTYIKRKGWVDIIQSNTLPIGVLPDIDYDSTVKKLYHGDYIIMVSDGVMEALPFLEKEEILMEIISMAKKKNPEQLAEEILQDALNYIGEYPCDDMTVIVAGIYERTHMVFNT